MRRMIVAMAVIFAAVLSISEASAVPIDRFIGQIGIQKEVIGKSGEYRGKPFILYHGDRVVIERDNESGGRIWIVAIYHSHADNTSSREECIIPLQRMEISSFRVTLNVLINEERIKQCPKSAH